MLKEFLHESNFTWEVILVDDGSLDSTSLAMDRIFSKNESQLIQLNKNRGKGHALRKGTLAVKSEIYLFTDADFSTPMSEFHKLSSYIVKGYDIAIGSRALADSKIMIPAKWYRRFMGRVFRLLVQTTCLGDLKDTQCGFKCFRRKALLPILLIMKVDRFCFDVEFLFIAKKWGLKVKEVPMSWDDSSTTTVNPLLSPLEILADLIKVHVGAFLGIYDPPTQ